MNEMNTKFQLTADNYYSDEANREYLSVSQFKDFVGTYGRMGCEEMALAKIRGEYKTELFTRKLCIRIRARDSRFSLPELPRKKILTLK